jgi:hypothetical protein
MMSTTSLILNPHIFILHLNAQHKTLIRKNLNYDCSGTAASKVNEPRLSTVDDSKRVVLQSTQNRSPAASERMEGFNERRGLVEQQES